MRPHHFRAVLLTAAVVVAGLAHVLADAVSAQEKAFEVASIRLVDPNAPASSASASGQFCFSATPYGLIMRAYSMPGFMAALRYQERPYLTGGPDWIRKDTYAIQAKLPAGTPTYTARQFFDGEAPEVDAMLATLLRERFALRFHREMREMPVFTLNVARNGHKMKSTQAKMIDLPDGSRRLQWAFTFRPFTTETGRGMFRLNAVNQAMPGLSQLLSDILDRPVLDRTGLSGAFDFDLEYAMDTDNPGVRSELTGPELFTALQEQAGLRLESTRAPIEVVVIDSIERPSEN